MCANEDIKTRAQRAPTRGNVPLRSFELYDLLYDILYNVLLLYHIYHIIYCKMYFLHDQFTAAERALTGDKPAPVKCTVAYLLLCDWAQTVYQCNA